MSMNGSAQSPTSTRGRLWDLMFERAQQGAHKGWVNATARDLAQMLGLEEHDVVHSLFDLREQGLVEFGLAKANRAARRQGAAASRATPYGGIPVRIRVSKTALRAGERPVVEEPPAPEPEPTPKPGLRPDHVVVDEARRIDTFLPPSVTVAEVSTVTLSAYPALARLASKEEKVSEAVRLIREAGLDALAKQVASQTETYSDVEQEAILLIRDLLGRGLMVEH